jgi:glycosyltransferase involved in cell wall biosynthesis
MRKKIIHLVSSPATSGVTATIRLLATACDPDRFEHHLVHYGPHDGIAPDLKSQGVPVHALAAPPLWTGALRTRLIHARLGRLLRRIRPDLIHAHSFDADLVAVRSRPDSVPVMVTCQSFSYIRWMERIPGQYARHGRKLSLYACVCQSLADGIRDTGIVPDPPVRVMFNVPDRRFFEQVGTEERLQARSELGLGPDDRVVACVANFHPVKGQDVLAEAFVRLSGRIPSLKLVLAGSVMPGPGCEEHRTGALSVLRSDFEAGRALLVDPCRDPRKVLAAADLYVQPSRTEALSVAIGEALACGLPVVATSVGGNPEIVLHEQTGLLVPPADPPAMAAAIERLISDESLCERLGRSGRRFAAANLSQDAMLESYRLVYEGLAGRIS